MPRLKKRITPRVESLETIALLSTMPGAHASAVGPSTGLGSIGSVTTNDAQALQQDGSGGFLEQYISEIESTYGRRADVRAYANAVVSDHQITSYDLQNTAGQVGLTIPSGIALPSDVNEAEQVLAAVRGGNVDRTYLRIMTQINAQDVVADQQLTNTTQDPAVAAYASEAQGYDQYPVVGARTLSRNLRATYTPTYPTSSINTPPTVTSPASSSDAQALQQDGSGGSLEQFISQIEEQRGTRSDAQAYAQTVVADHQVTNYDLQATAQGAGVAIPAGITQASDIQYARQVLAAVRSGNLDRVYIQVMAKINAQDVANDRQLIGSTQDSAVSAYAQETLSYDMMHLQGAQTLGKQRSNTFTPAG